jgi:hypothetical protein
VRSRVCVVQKPAKYKKYNHDDDDDDDDAVQM